MKKRLTQRILLVLIYVFASGAIVAQSNSQAVDPRSTLQTSIDKLISDFTVHRVEFEADKGKLYAFAEKALNDNWDFGKMAQLVLGKYWRRINDDQKLRFTEAFRSLMVRTYATTMFKYTGKEAILLEDPIYKGKTNNRAVVNASGSLGDGSEPIPLAFSMFLDGDGVWRIYNIAAAGISLVTTYRDTYGQIIAANGIDYLIDSLNDKSDG